MMKKFLRRYLKRQDIWSIGIYAGGSPCHLSSPEGIKNPVLTAKNVTDRKALFVADPFMVHEQGAWYMFFEVLDRETEKGEIGLAISKDAWHWEYQQIILSEPFHLSYPYIFRWQDEFYMIPESHERKTIRLYKASSFPCHWVFVGDLLTGYDFVDSSVFSHNNRLWLFTCPTTNSDILKLFYSSDLKGPWLEHPANPIINGNAHIARCGGRVIAFGDTVIRYAQDDYPDYGNCLHAFEITKLTEKEYQEKGYTDNPILRAGKEKWNSMGMHSVDPHYIEDNTWIACVDGKARVVELRKNILRA